MHTFKRYYLLGAILLAYSIPLLTFVEYVDIPVVARTVGRPNPNQAALMNAPYERDLMAYVPVVLWSVYFLGLALFGFKFIKNLSDIIAKIRRNPKLRINRITNVLLNQSITPHTFFSYIFLNRQRFEAKQIPQEVLLHEETHARQKHSLDVLFIEFLQVIMWFNPFIYVIKKSIKLNHEFLADREVLTKGVPPALYQNILLRFSSDPYNQHSAKLANAINYSSIKKRFTVMKTKTSKKSMVLRSIALLPIMALLIFGFSERKVTVIESTVKTSVPGITQYIPTENIDIRITENGDLILQERDVITLKSLKSHLSVYNTQLSKEQRSEVVRAAIRPKADVSLDLLERIEAILVDYGVAQVNIIGPEEYTDPNLQTIEQKEASQEQIDTYNSLAKKYTTQPVKTRVIPLKDLRTLEKLYRSMNAQQKKVVNPFPECPPQEGATKKQIKEYNVLAKKYNRQLSDAKEIRILKSDVERLEHLHGLMTHEQKENAEPFPDFPEPPAPPKVPESLKVKKGGKSDIPPPPAPPSPLRHQDAEAPNIIDEIIANQDPYDNLNTMDPMPSSKKISIDLPPIPPTPISPLDHVIEMAKKDAIFYYGGKEISSDKAIDILKKNTNINIDTRGSKSKQPVVRLSTEPIVIQN
ncbi:M56 family metallopeptidase [Maribacter sp.]|uniref:M56 family metallopeptidase n=1 Tax=Maribacter sp. TaxID=1897614 RepID=UPI003C746308